MIGKCSNCGGDVVIPNAYYSVRPPKPQCQECHATVKSKLPVVEMEPSRPIQVKGSIADWDPVSDG